MQRTELLELIVKVLPEFTEEPHEIDEFTTLYGEMLDSIGLVAFLIEIEQQVSNKIGKEITIADDRAMSLTHSPFRTVKSLCGYVLTLI